MKEMVISFFFGVACTAGMLTILFQQANSDLKLHELTHSCETGVLLLVTRYGDDFKKELTDQEKSDRIRYVGNSCLEYATTYLENRSK